ncbi:MAG: hypothetical protein WDN02_07605 [Methylovirgula sp.]|uniref:hypothetical protein n=1 Tax=Methylovirgula sp. TaxID=1978224 RepID=UPI002F0B187C
MTVEDLPQYPQWKRALQNMIEAWESYKVMSHLFDQHPEALRRKSNFEMAKAQYLRVAYELEMPGYLVVSARDVDFRHA